MAKDKELFIVVTQTGTFVSRVIKFVTKAPYNHVSLSLDENLDKMYSFARKRPPHVFPSGFMQETMSNSLFGMIDTIPCQIYQVRVSEKQYETVGKMIDAFDEIANEYKFNVLGFVSMFFRFRLRRAKRFMCSQFVAYVLSNSHIITFDKDYSLVTPEDIRKNEKMIMIFDGDLKEYVSGKAIA